MIAQLSVQHVLRFKPTLFLLVLFAVIASCKDFIEPSITGRQVQLNAPVNNLQSTSYAVSFWWNEVDDALTYHLQIVKPKFDSVEVLVADTIVKANKATFTLSPGIYQWHVRAENGSSQTPYSPPRSFTIAYSSIKQQKVQLTAPTNTLLTNLATLTFSWNSLYGANKYRLQIDTNNFTDTTKLVYNQATPAQQLIYTLNRDQVYQWRVRAENDTAKAQWSVIYNFTYDHTPPGQVTLSTPVNNQMTVLPITLNWNQVATANRYKLYVLKNDSTSLYSNTFPIQVTTTNYTLTQGNAGERLYWKVSALDAAGNEGKASALRSFVLQ